MKNEFFYVTVIDGKRVGYLAGPFPDHQSALDQVDAVRKAAEDIDCRCAFYAFGTCKTDKDIGRGTLNHKIGLPTRRER